MSFDEWIFSLTRWTTIKRRFHITCISLHLALNDIIIIIVLHMIRPILNVLKYGVSDFRDLYVCSSVVTANNDPNKPLIRFVLYINTMQNDVSISRDVFKGKLFTYLCQKLILLENSFDPNQACQEIGPDLDTYCLTL